MLNHHYAKEAEQAVLGGLLLDNNKLLDVTDLLVTEDFYEPMHRELFAIFLKLTRDLKPLDCLVVGDYLKTVQSKIPEVFVYELVKNTPSAANILTYANLVLESSRKRQLLKIYETGIASINATVDENIAKLEDDLFKLTRRTEQELTVNVADDLKALVSEIDELLHSDKPFHGLSSGFKNLDELTNGFNGGELIVIGARPAMGKTSLAMNIVENLAKASRTSLIFSLEMKRKSLILRMIASLGRINFHDLRTGKTDDTELMQKVSKATDLLRQGYIHINDKSGLNPYRIMPLAKRWMRENQRNLDLIVVDYLQLLRIPTYKTGQASSRYNEVSEVSNILKATANELNIPVIALAQLNRVTDSQDDKRPKMANLRDSGGIEQDADLILMLYRDEVYHPDSADKGTAELNIVKQRNGAIGKVRLSFISKYMRFENYAQY